jgi:hypothetical protein
MNNLNNRVNELRKQIVEMMNKGDKNKWCIIRSTIMMLSLAMIM